MSDPKATVADVYYVASDQSLTAGGTLLPPGCKITLGQPVVLGPDHEVEHKLDKARCEHLCKSGVLNKTGPKRSAKQDLVPLMKTETNEQSRGGARDGEKAENDKTTQTVDQRQVGGRWRYTDEQVTGKSLEALNAIIIEGGAEPQGSVEDAIMLLQSDLRK